MSTLLVLGGARSGKSRYAQQRAEAFDGALAYIATAQARDGEMAERIARHQADRDSRWRTINAPLDLASAIRKAADRHDAILIDCLTLWLSNLIEAEIALSKAFDDLVRTVSACPRPLALVANEVGLGIVPHNALARRFRDEAGRLNQRMADCCNEVVFIAAGLPMQLKATSS
ncbi:bifunctional adenosylcobinamide kinase/adenosylcobinamide-phosphate guanylyltransferase [Novosphingobium sp.]|uniref:bifunctional adenosylcobinamide kinase/adenosylcobinamide-phosphate guanylyltransferase n=1 Tax=Novosphingobium sp. TaxID=1874826 RepID=UPI002B46757E|nr:bifunctional adenosylcobinamide kinase/adenosylcobinamide-phosphate guanylyltransferase [Novosphingobium sp.]HKR93501.1 bifunctional adenosylcobinamide kinase/adenosylcobinamide-phosphate guanylyltransferase [Novosphingobium sp.]